MGAGSVLKKEQFVLGQGSRSHLIWSRKSGLLRCGRALSGGKNNLSVWMFTLRQNKTCSTFYFICMLTCRLELYSNEISASSRVQIMTKWTHNTGLFTMWEAIIS
jgi:hypothetical protein